MEQDIKHCFWFNIFLFFFVLLAKRVIYISTVINNALVHRSFILVSAFERPSPHLAGPACSFWATHSLTIYWAGMRFRSRRQTQRPNPLIVILVPISLSLSPPHYSFPPSSSSSNNINFPIFAVRVIWNGAVFPSWNLMVIAFLERTYCVPSTAMCAGYTSPNYPMVYREQSMGL